MGKRSGRATDAAPGDDEATTSVEAALAEFNRVFGSNDANRLTDLFADDARLLLLHGEAMEGREAIRKHWTRSVERFDASAWQAEPVIVDVHDDRAYTLSTYTETLVSLTGGPRQLVVGRLVLFFRRETGGAWRITLAMNSHVRPVELLPVEG